jgi:hypothetical protein
MNASPRCVGIIEFSFIEKDYTGVQAVEFLRNTADGRFGGEGFLSGSRHVTRLFGPARASPALALQGAFPDVPDASRPDLGTYPKRKLLASLLIVKLRPPLRDAQSPAVCIVQVFAQHYHTIHVAA